jgi:biopolymer transport protein ExbD
VTIDTSDKIYWNGTEIDLIRLRQYLDITQTMNPIPELHLQPDPQARYVTVDQVLAVTKRAQVEKMGFVGNEAYGAF